MNHNPNRARLIGLALSTALATTALAGCATQGHTRANAAASRAESAMAKGNTQKAVSAAEDAVMSEPRNAAYRTILGTAYLNDGRFSSAAATFKDAMALGDASSRNALSLALADIGAGDFRNALAVLDNSRDQIAPADLGLAYALAGQPDRAVHILEHTLRGGDNTPKVRQNLAYSYALAGRWREARLMASQDVPADRINDRISEWAEYTHPLAFQQRVATLLSVPVGRNDPGQPAALALANFPAVEQVASATPTPSIGNVGQNSYSSGDYSGGELPAVSQQTAQPANSQPVREVALARYEAPIMSEPQNFEAELAAAAPQGATPAALIADTVRFVSQPTVQKISQRFGIKPQLRAAPTFKAAGGNNLVQLGSFSSKEGAERAIGIFAKRHAGLGGHAMNISRATVDGKSFWRVSASGFAEADARNLCSTVKQRGGGCIQYSAGNPLPGAID